MGYCRERPAEGTGLGRGVPGGTPEARVDGGPQHPDRVRAGRDGRRGVEQRFAKELVALQPDSLSPHARPRQPAALLQQTRTIPIVFAIVADPVGSGFVASFPRPGGNVTGFTTDRADDGRQVAGAAQGDRAARQPGRLLVQPGNGALCRVLPEPLQGRRCVLRRGGDRSHLFATGPSSNPSLPHRHARRMAA